MNANDEIAIVLYVVITCVVLFCLYRLIQNSNSSDSVSDNTTTSKSKVTFEEDSIENPLVV